MSEVLVVTLVQAIASTQLTKRDGGTYPGAKLLYTVNGTPAEKGIHAKILENNPDLFAKIKALEGRSGVPLKLIREKSGNFWNILDIQETTAEAVQQFAAQGFRGGASRGGAKGGQDVERIARQNGLTAAVTLLAGAKGSTAEDVVAVAAEFTDFILGKAAQAAVPSSAEAEATVGSSGSEAGSGASSSTVTEGLPF